MRLPFHRHISLKFFLLHAVLRQPHESMYPACQQGTVLAGGGSLMMWDLCRWSNVTPLIRLDTTLTCDRFVHILADHLDPVMCILQSDGLGQFQ